MMNHAKLVKPWLAQAWQWSILLSVLSFGLWIAAIIAAVYAVAGRSWFVAGALALAAFICTVLVQVLRVAIVCAVCLQSIAGWGGAEAPPLAGEGGQ